MGNGKPNLQTSDRELETAALECLAGPEFDGLPELTVFPTGQIYGGEAQQIHSRGGRYVSIVGHHALFHQESDRWPHAVDVSALTAYATALATLALRLAA